MASGVKLILNLPPADSLFSTQDERDDAKLERIMDIPLDKISDFPNHPFKVQVDAEMLEMAESVKQYGVLITGLVRPKDGGSYEMVAGHRRFYASQANHINNLKYIATLGTINKNKQ